MKPWLHIPVLVALILAAAVPCPAQENARQFIAAMEAYNAGDYASAIQGLETIARNGTRNGALYYNLGNAYLKNDNLGLAILWYERALPLLPHDPDLRFNYDYARSLTKDAQETPPTSLVRIFFFWKYQLSPRATVLVAIGANLLFWCLAIVWRLTGRRAVRHAALIILAPAVVFIFTAAYNYYEAAHLRQGIVLPSQVSIRSGLEETATELFVLHAGAKVKIIKAMKTHYQIRFSKDKFGWVGQEKIGVI